VRSFSRNDEPEAVARREGRSLEWGTEYVLSREKDTPDVIFDEGGWGKEPMIRVVGKDPQDVVTKVAAVLKEVS